MTEHVNLQVITVCLLGFVAVSQAKQPEMTELVNLLPEFAEPAL